jgi:hypothetical protein
MTQKEAFLTYLQRMDIDMLDMILDDSIIYFGASKRVFLKKLSYIFNQVRLGGHDGFLKIKQHKKQPNTYYLLLEIFSHTNQFIIEENEGKIVNIHGGKIKTKKDDVENLSPLALFFGTDERADFKPTNEYTMNVYRCTSAYEELVNDNVQILTSEDISQWINKHTWLFEEVKDAYLLFSYNNFKTLFSSLDHILQELQHYNEVKLALQTFTNSTASALQQWLGDYFNLAFCKVPSFHVHFSEIDIENKTLRYSYRPTIYFKGDDFVSIIKFNDH